MRLSSVALLAALLSTSLIGCDGGASKGGAESTSAAPKQEIGTVLATVNGMEVGSIEFEQSAQRKSPAAGDQLSLEEKKEVLNKLVEEKLLYLEALKKGLDKDPKVQKVMVNTLLRQDVYASVKNSDFNDAELQAYYEAHKDEFIVPEKVQIKRILIKVSEQRSDADAKKLADEVYAGVKKDPAAFKDLAGKHSEDPYKRRGGDVGFVAKTGKPGLDQAVVDKAFEMAVEQVSEPFKTSEGYNIVVVANKRERVERTYAQMKGSVLRKVKNDRLKNLYDSYVTDLRTGAKIEIKEDALGKLEVKSSRKAGAPGMVLNPGEGMDDEGMDAPEAPALPGGAPTPGEAPAVGAAPSAGGEDAQ